MRDFILRLYFLIKVIFPLFARTDSFGLYNVNLVILLEYNLSIFVATFTTFLQFHFIFQNHLNILLKVVLTWRFTALRIPSFPVLFICVEIFLVTLYKMYTMSHVLNSHVELNMYVDIRTFVWVYLCILKNLWVHWESMNEIFSRQEVSFNNKTESSDIQSNRTKNFKIHLL